MSMSHKGNCEHLKEGYCIACISKISDDWGATAMTFSKDSKCYINVWDGDYPKWIEVKDNNEQSEQMKIAREVMKQDSECLRNLSKNNDDTSQNFDS